jgi:hypothetical protein
MSFITLISASVVRFVKFKDLNRVSCFRVVIDRIEDNDCLSIYIKHENKNIDIILSVHDAFQE